MIARGDSGTPTHGFVNACRAANVRLSIGFDLTEKVRSACRSVPARRWCSADTFDGGDERDGAEVAEITGLSDLRVRRG